MENSLTLILAFALSLGLTCLIMPFYIKALKNHNINQSVSEYALDEYKNKAKTPIMGGLIFVVVPVIVYVLIHPSFLKEKEIIFVYLSFALYCLVGFMDDYTIIIKHNNDGLSPSFKLFLELIFTLGLYLVFRNSINTEVHVPFTQLNVNMPWFIFLPFMILLFQAEANAVNFTDGMDGLCAGVSMLALIPFALIAYKQGNMSIVILILAVIGGLIGYLFFNWHPAKIFMGDSGSLALGGLFASLSIVLKCEVALFVIGGVFVIEMFCVCLQLTSVKLFHKRVFSYTPIHYAFVLKGYKETSVVKGFYLLESILALIGLFIGLH